MVDIPCQHPTQSYWLRDNPYENFRSTPDLPSRSDIVIIGAGISGLSLAYHLLTLGCTKQITILDARGVGGGATGRNGGHLTPLTYRSFRANCVRYGAENWCNRLRFERENAAAVKKLVHEHGWEEEYGGIDGVILMQAFLGVKEFEEAKMELNEMAKYQLGRESTIWEREEAQHRLKGRQFVGAVHNALGGHLWPAKLLYALTTLILKSNVNLQTHTPVTNVISGPSNYLLHTPRGTLSCTYLIHATNAYASHLLPDLAQAIIPVRGQVIAISPTPNAFQHPISQRNQLKPPTPHWDFGVSVNRGFEYMCQKPDGTIVFGGGREAAEPRMEFGVADDSAVNEDIGRLLRRVVAEWFDGAVKEPVDVDIEWTGIMGYSEDGFPWAGPIGDNTNTQYVCAGFHGHGMALAFHSAKAVAQQILGRPVDVPGWIPEMFLPREKLKTVQPGTAWRMDQLKLEKLRTARL
ncbi:hypothetical protein HK104_008704 [Borealophlyctis nickersoniae]|nr:hypothetical protein HK104_008704 [Borealophlyctis nickersoniae]